MLESDGVKVWEIQKEDGREIARVVKGYHYSIHCLTIQLVVPAGQPLTIQLGIRDWQDNVSTINTSLTVWHGNDKIIVPVTDGAAEFDFAAHLPGTYELLIIAEACNSCRVKVVVQ